MRTILLPLGLLLAHGLLGPGLVLAQESSPIDQGATIRVTVPSLYPEPILGSFLGIEDGALLMEPSSPDHPRRLAMDAVTRLEEQQGRSRGEGAVIGGLLGALGWIVVVKASDSSTSSMGYVYVPLAAVGGALIGRGIAGGTRWVPVTLPPSPNLAGPGGF